MVSIAYAPPGSLPVEGLDEPLQLIDPTGQRRHHATLDPFVADTDIELLTDLLVDMHVLRALDIEATALQRQGELALWGPALGQEATQIAAGSALRDQDFAFTSYREHGIALARGVAIGELLPMWQGTTLGGWDPHERRIAPMQIIIGAQTLHAAGWAMAAKSRGTGGAALTVFGDGATSEGDVNEAMVFAASFGAPVVFLCQNNQYAISEPVRVQSGVPLAMRPVGFGISSLRVDGNDVLAMFAAMRWAFQRADAGEGPSFIEAVTYRMGPHTTSDDPSRYRDEAELEYWKARCPISRVEAFLEGLGAPMGRIREEIEIRTRGAVNEAREAMHEPAADPVTMLDDAYATPHRGLERQRIELRAFLDSVEAHA